MADEKRLLTAVVKCQHDGFGFDLTAELHADELPVLIGKLRHIGIEPANGKYVWPAQQDVAPRTQPVNGNAPLCPAHGTIMTASEYRAGEFYCMQRTGQDSATGKAIYCTEQMTETGVTR